MIAGDVDNTSLNEAALAINRIFSVTANVSAANATIAMVEQALAGHDQLDIIFSKTNVRLKYSAVDLPEQDWKRMLAVDVKDGGLPGKFFVPLTCPAGSDLFIIAASANNFHANRVLLAIAPRISG